ncbi:hypothetical protein ARMSODRAFT_1024913 [Armillaria solidipes]|uniref:Uncharacterized protein n=1 Tax=Armillaria solidipes TaxID=1076256 RepID=A0A2H3BCJ0_9AGAR|nr:hypothetical protein ARMSODRAFT_1024913 [Armillaria solidipes]
MTTRTATPTSSPDDQPHPQPHPDEPDPEGTTTPSTHTAPTTSGPNSPPSTRYFSAPPGSPHGNFDEQTSIEDIRSSAAVDQSWTFTSPSTEASPSPVLAPMQKSHLESLLTETERSDDQTQGTEYAAPTKTKPPRSSENYISHYMPSPSNKGTVDEPRLPWQRQHQLRNEIGQLT